MNRYQIKHKTSGKINGSAYEGECCCFVGTLEKAHGSPYDSCVVRDQQSPKEKAEAMRAIGRPLNCLEGSNSPADLSAMKEASEILSRNEEGK